MTEPVAAANDILAPVDAYLSRVALDPDRKRALRAAVRDDQPAGREQALERLHVHLGGPSSKPGGDRAGSEQRDSEQDEEISARLAGAYPHMHTAPPVAASSGRYRAASMPPLNRWPMSPRPIDRRPWRFLDALFPGRAARGMPRPVPSRLKNVVRLRQCVLVLMVALPALGATFYMGTVLPHRGGTGLEVVILSMAFLLFAWILVGFWTALSGFMVLWRGDRYSLTGESQDADREDDDGARTAIIMPIYEEDVTRTLAGIRAIYESLEATGRLNAFDFFILSDSIEADTIVAEQNGWANLCRELDAFDHIHYRRRRARVKRKSGNVADFCRRWGGRYRYMIVLDADSIMSGRTLATLVDRMQANPGVGLIQTAPIAVNRTSLLARVQQFATRVYGRMFAAGLHFWHLDNAHYWGHNAIIRIAPFMAHCALPRLPGRGALSGDILSHDFVEAALMRRAGWGVFIAYDLPGSYEEVPPTLLDELGRDRRWCQGNIQHIRLLFSDNLAPAHRALFANGVMAYTSAAIWLVFLLLSSIEAVMEAMRTPDYFPVAGSLFPQWPVWQPIWALSLFVATLVVLFLPKVLGVIIIVARRRQRDFGGVGALIGSTLIEIFLTSLLAPLRMLAHARFVFITALGRQVKWNSQQRADAQVGWLRALAFHWPGMLLALVWGSVLYWYTPGFAPWLAPILGPLLFAPVITVVTSRVDIGRWMKKNELQLTPEERRPPPELARIIALEASAPREPGFGDAVVDPMSNALHIGLQGRARRLNPELRAYREDLARRALAGGADTLTAYERRQLLADPGWMRWLHARVWADAPPAWSPWLTPG